ncbi:MAG: D-arabinose 5-phosphate isomerase [Candidatus Cloacimonas sp. 4484_275]|nr:MAG: D-arabinose 5-phosphate isomerase [Candidatus Cloacimonas sp. 4484_275]
MNITELVKRELKTQAKAISEVAENIDSSVEKAVKIIYNCTGKVVVTGMGKTGIIARKIAATLSSTGTTAIFLHAAEGIHGDLGIIQKNDVIIAVSYSGNTEEVVSIIPYFKLHKIPVIAITGNPASRLANNSDVVINCFVKKEYEPFGMIPTASTTAALAIGDAISVVLLKLRNFRESDFIKYHPGGTIGKKLILRVSDLMHKGENNPVVSYREIMKKVILEMTGKGLGCTSIVDENGKLVGIVTDGDLRRFLQKGKTDLNISVTEVMTKSPKSVSENTLAIDALNVMEENKITMLPVINDKNEPIGMLHMHDLINAGIV